MKPAALQTATEEISFSQNLIYQGLVEKFNNLFTSKKITERSFISKPINEGSQFYKTLVRLAGTGIRVRATVLYANETGLLVNNDPVINLTLRFHLNTTESVEITAKTVVPKIAIPQAADIITIAYDENDLSLVAVL